MSEAKNKTNLEKSNCKNPSIFDEVVAGGYCIGCGACASINPNIQMEFDDYGMYKPVEKAKLDEVDISNPAKVCPFLGEGSSEDDLASKHFAISAAHDPVVGYYLENYAGYVAEDTFRASGSSGGFGTWLPLQLLKHGLVDAVVHVKEVSGMPDRETFFEYAISTDEESVRKGAKSRYYPIEMSAVIDHVKKFPGKYAFVGLPCFIKSIRLLQKNDPILAERIPYCLGIVCGHLKSKYYGEYLAWQSGVKPSELLSLDFRHKEPGNRAKGYVLRASGIRDDKEFEAKRPVSELYGGNWGLGFFKNNACDYCDDVFAECADVVMGDAWLPEYDDDMEGTSLLVVRNKNVLDILKNANERGDVKLDELTVNQAKKSQAAGIRHRREGLAYRLFVAIQAGKWVPVKRVKPTVTLSIESKLKYLMRIKLLEKSHEAYKLARENRNVNTFKKKMCIWVIVYSIVIILAKIKSKIVNFSKINCIK